MKKYAGNSKGFTLVETAIVLVIGGLILTMLFNSLDIYLKNTKLNTTRDRLAQIDNQIQVYLEDNGRLPCPASRFTQPNTVVGGVAFGQQEACSGSVTGIAVANTGANAVRIGMVPTRTINLPDEYAFDAWGNRILYAMTEILGTDSTYDRTKGKIGIVDLNDHSVIVPSDSAHYVVLSHGANKAGGYNATGSIGVPCPSAGSPTPYERENCDDNAKFRRSILIQEGSNQYDDLLVDQSGTDFSRKFPAEAIVLFALPPPSTCPDGWDSNNVPTSPDASKYRYCRKR